MARNAIVHPRLVPVGTFDGWPLRDDRNYPWFFLPISRPDGTENGPGQPLMTLPSRDKEKQPQKDAGNTVAVTRCCMGRQVLLVFNEALPVVGFLVHPQKPQTNPTQTFEKPTCRPGSPTSGGRF